MMRSLFTRPVIRGAALGAMVALGGSAQAASLQQGFRQAADEFNVPAELLMAVSYVTTSWYNARGIDPHSAQEFGVMGLRNQEEGPSLAEASALLRTSAQKLRDDQQENIRGGAALLAAYAREANGGRAVPADLTLETAAQWWAAAGKYAGVADARHQDLFATHVFEALDQGAEGRAESGELVRLAPTSLPSVIGDWIDDARAQARRQAAAAPDATDYPGASWVPASNCNYSNYSRTAADISRIVIHKIEGSYSGCISWFQNCSAQVSAHYVVSKNGDVTQMVLEQDVAWHAGNWDYNLTSVGIEHEGYTAKDDVTDAMYRASAALSKNVADRNAIPKTRQYIIGHNEVPGATHTDPGPYWDWDYYMQLIGGTGGGGTDPQTGDMVGFIKAEDIYNGTPLAGASVTLSGNGVNKSTSTNSSGYYEFSGLPVGTYTITADANCYGAVTISRSVTANVDNWGSIALMDDGSCTSGDGSDDGTADGTDDAGACRMMTPQVPSTRIHTASTSPLDRLPTSSFGFVVGLTGGLILWRRRRS